MIRGQFVAWAGLVTLATCTVAAGAAQPTEAQLKLAQPLIAPWTGPYGGVPPFDNVRTDEIALALEVGMARDLAEIDRISTNPQPPTFENTIAAPWSNTITADAWESFLENGGPWDRAQPAKLKELLWQGNTVEPTDACRQFRGRDPDVGTLMRKRGLPAPPKADAAGHETAPSTQQ